MATIVIHSRTQEKISGTCGYEWSKHTFHRLMSGELVTKSVLLTRQKALDVIRRLGLVESHRTEDGEIYDTPDGEFKRLFPDGVRTKQDLQKIEQIDNL